jgi:PRTRC genetic system protein C
MASRRYFSLNEPRRMNVAANGRAASFPRENSKRFFTPSKYWQGWSNAGHNRDELLSPNPNMSFEQVRERYIPTHPDITTATVTAPETLGGKLRITVGRAPSSQPSWDPRRIWGQPAPQYRRSHPEKFFCFRWEREPVLHRYLSLQWLRQQVNNFNMQIGSVESTPHAQLKLSRLRITKCALHGFFHGSGNSE